MKRHPEISADLTVVLRRQLAAMADSRNGMVVLRRWGACWEVVALSREFSGEKQVARDLDEIERKHEVATTKASGK